MGDKSNGKESSDRETAGSAGKMDRRRLMALSIAALGVVFGDIGTSPLYAIRECFYGEYGIAASRANILGVLSLIFWALILIVSLKYLTFILLADNHGIEYVYKLCSFLPLVGILTVLLPSTKGV